MNKCVKRETAAGFFYIVVLTKTTVVKKSKGGQYSSFILYDGTIGAIISGDMQYLHER